MGQDKEVTLNFNFNDKTTDTFKFLVPAGEKGEDGTNANICDAFKTLPKGTSFGEHPLIIVHSDGECRVVEVPSKGIFTDIRSQAAWVGSALKGASNEFKATARNASLTDSGKVRLDIVLPVSAESAIVYGASSVSAPTGTIVTPIITSGSSRSYEIQNLKPGMQVDISTKITWNVIGTFQASATINSVDPAVIDYSASDDYSVASYTVSPTSDGIVTIDCPLIEASINGIALQVNSIAAAISHTQTDQSFLKGLIVIPEPDGTFLIKFNRSVTVYLAQPTTSIVGMYDADSDTNMMANFTFNKNSSLPTDAGTIVPIDATNTVFRVNLFAAAPSYINIPKMSAVCIIVQAGAGCNLQWMSVFVDRGYKIGQTLTLKNNGANVPSHTKGKKISNASSSTYNIRHVDGTTHTIITVNNAEAYMVEQLNITMKQATAYDFDITSTSTPEKLPSQIVNIFGSGPVTITRTSATQVKFVANTNTSDKESATNGSLKYDFVQ